MPLVPLVPLAFPPRTRPVDFMLTCAPLLDIHRFQVVGTWARWSDTAWSGDEGEGADRADLLLPINQSDLITVGECLPMTTQAHADVLLLHSDWRRRRVSINQPPSPITIGRTSMDSNDTASFAVLPYLTHVLMCPLLIIIYGRRCLQSPMLQRCRTSRSHLL